MLAFSRFTDGNHTLGYILRTGIARSLGVHTNTIRKANVSLKMVVTTSLPPAMVTVLPFSTIFLTLELIGAIISPTPEFIGL